MERTLRTSLALTTTGALSCAALLGLTNHSALEMVAQLQPTAAATTAAPVAEDDPGWDCYTMGNRVCGDPEGIHAADAWEAWDRTQGWRHLRTTTDETKVVYVGDAHQPLAVHEGEVAIPGKGKEWYLFRAVPTGCTAEDPCSSN